MSLTQSGWLRRRSNLTAVGRGVGEVEGRSSLQEIPCYFINRKFIAMLTKAHNRNN